MKAQKFFSCQMDVVARWILVALALILAAEMLCSLQWRMSHDTPILYYLAMLIQHYDFVPYRDVFETSFPGTILSYYLLAKLFGYSDLAFRIIDLLLLVYVMGISYLIMRCFDKTVAALGAISFGLVYLGVGPILSMQREFIALVPLATAIFLATNSQRVIPEAITLLGVGACFGFVASIKPHLAIGICPALLYITCTADGVVLSCARSCCMRFLKNAVIAGAGFIIIFALPCLWVWHQGGWTAFTEMVQKYLPLYLQMTGDHEKLTQGQHLVYILKQWRMSHSGFWIVAVLGGYIAIEVYSENKKMLYLVLFLLAEVMLYSLCPVLAGQFWVNHWVPFFWFCCLCGGWLFLPMQRDAMRIKALAGFAVYLLFLAMTFRLAIGAPAQGVALRQQRVDHLATFLRANLKPGDTVQPLDSIGGTLQALLLSGAELATPYLCDYYFHHDLSNAYIQAIKNRFMAHLHGKPPQFIIDASGKLRPKGIDTSDHFDEFEAFIAGSYHTVYTEDGVTVYGRNTPVDK